MLSRRAGRDGRGTAAGLERLAARVAACERCPRLRTYCREVAVSRRRAYADWTYWGRPVPGFGDPRAQLYVLGLAPAAHGGNRTGRVFTGDRSGDFLMAALHRAGFANQSVSAHRGDGLRLRNAYIAAAVRCAPPANKPTPEETERCREYMDEELRLLSRVRVVLALGKFAHDAYLRRLKALGQAVRLSGFPFAHGARHDLPEGPTLFDVYHPSQQNTFTGKLRPRDLDRVLTAIRATLSRR
jgi:uracil-DNA glycosylase family 4